MRRAGLLLLALVALAGPPSEEEVREPRIPILMYHRIGEPVPGAAGLDLVLACPRLAFRAHLAFLQASGFEALTFDEVLAAGIAGRALPKRAVILTFDDGLSCHFEAFQELRRAGMKGVFFVVSEALDREGRLTRRELRAMADSGMEIGSHSATHPDLRRLDAAGREREIAGSKREVEAVIGRRVIAFAYPGGAYDAPCLSVLARAGYVFARTTEPGIADVRTPAFELQAVPIWRGTDARKLAGKLARLGVPGLR